MMAHKEQNDMVNAMSSVEAGKCLKVFRQRIGFSTRKAWAIELQTQGLLPGKTIQLERSEGVSGAEQTVRRWENGETQRVKDKVLESYARVAKSKGYKRLSGGKLSLLLKGIYSTPDCESWLRSLDLYRPVNPPKNDPLYGGKVTRAASGELEIDKGVTVGPMTTRIVAEADQFDHWEAEGPGWTWIVEGKERANACFFVQAGTVQTFLLPKNQRLQIATTILLDGHQPFEAMAGYVRGLHGASQR